LKIRSVRPPFHLHAPINAGPICDFTHPVTHWGVAGTRIQGEDGDYVRPEMPGADWTLTEVAMSSYAKPC
jgi:hypothetical protein